MSTPATTIQDDVEDSPMATLVEPLLPPPPQEAVVVLASDDDPSQVLEEHVSLELPPLRADESTWEHGETQMPSCRNWVWALLFLCQITSIATLAIMAMVALSKGDYQPDNDQDPWYKHLKMVDGLLYFIAMIFSISVLSTTLILLLLGALADMMIQVSLVISPITCGFTALGSLLLGQVGMALILGIVCALGVWYAVGVWHRIPFATANLAVAMAAIRANKGLLSMAYATTVMAILWALTWIMALVQVSMIRYEWIMECTAGSNSNGDVECELTTQGKWILVGLLCSLFWTSQVIKNVFHTTIAGVVGTFWFSPAATDSESNGGCCGYNSTILDSWVRSSIYSFGSICLGSLLVAILQVLQVLVRIARQQRSENRQNHRRQHGSLLWCMLEFVVDQLEKLMEYFNSWAFVYVGLYGYEYATAGHKVYQLFRARGWSVILNDHLVARSLAMMQFFIGLLSGALAVVLGLVFPGIGFHPVATFWLGILLGMTLSNIQLQVVTSAVETAVVCFAEAPSSLLENHPPELSGRMIRAWRAAYPDECGF